MFSCSFCCCSDVREFCVATTHLLYNPKAGEVKLAQMSCLFAELHRMATIPGTTIIYYPPYLAYWSVLTTDPHVNFEQNVLSLDLVHSLLYIAHNKPLCPVHCCQVSYRKYMCSHIVFFSSCRKWWSASHSAVWWLQLYAQLSAGGLHHLLLPQLLQDVRHGGGRLQPQEESFERDPLPPSPSQHEYWTQLHIHGDRGDR